MKSRLMLCAVLAGLVQTVFAEAPPGLEIRRYPVLPNFANHFAASGTDDMMDFFAQLGVKWPEGSYMKFFPSLDMLIVNNTPENLRDVDNLLLYGPMIPFLIDIQVDFIAFKMEDVERLARQRDLSAPSLLALWRKGDAKLLASPRVMTRNGNETTVKGVTEYLYPTEFTVAAPTGTNAPPSTAATGVVVPDEFEMREVGVILQALPEVSPSRSMINVVLSPRIVHPPTWKNFGCIYESADGQKAGRPMEQPFFPVQTIMTSVSVANGATVMIGGGMNDLAGDRTVFVFMTARLLDVYGRPIATEVENGDP